MEYFPEFNTDFFTFQTPSPQSLNDIEGFDSICLVDPVELTELTRLCSEPNTCADGNETNFNDTDGISNSPEDNPIEDVPTSTTDMSPFEDDDRIVCDRSDQDYLQGSISEHVTLLLSFGFPYFRNCHMEGPPPLNDIKTLKDCGFQNTSFIEHQPVASCDDRKMPLQMMRWSTEENHKLVELVKDYGGDQEDVNWQQVTSDFNEATQSTRTVFQCFQRYQSRYSSHRVMHWSEEDNATVLNLIADMKISRKELLPWRVIRSYFPGRTLAAIYSHFNYHSPSTRKGDKFDKHDDWLILQAVRLGLDARQLEPCFGYMRPINQIRNRIKVLTSVSNCNRNQPTGRFPTSKSKSNQIATELLQLVQNSRDTVDDLEELSNKICEVQQRFTNCKRFGRPRKSKVAMEEELRYMMRPLTFINNKRTRQKSMPGDGREHCLILAALYRLLGCNFSSDLIPAQDRRQAEDLTRLGIESADHGAFTNLLDLIPAIPDDGSDARWLPHSFEQRRIRFLPPTLATFTGTRGLLLYTPALDMQARGEATCFNSAGQIQNSDEIHPAVDAEEHQRFGDADADELLLMRLLSLFYWPQKVIQQGPRILAAEHCVLQPDTVAPPSKKRVRRK